MDQENRTVEAAIATETAVVEFDETRWEYVPRTLLAECGNWPEQVPLLDAHDRSSTCKQLGSIRNLRVEDGEIVGRLCFSSLAEEQFTKVREGHITDISAGFRVDDEDYIKAGETAEINGREFTGPMNVAKSWTLREGSLVPIGADQAAKLRGLDPDKLPRKGDKPMNERMRELLRSHGMPEGLEEEAEVEWMRKHFEDVKPQEETAGEVRTETAEVEVNIAAIVDERLKIHDAAREEVRADRDAICDLADMKCPEEWYDLSTVEFRKALQDAKTKRQENVGPNYRMADSQPRDRGLHAVGTAMKMRALTGTPINDVSKVFPEDQRSKNADDFQFATFLEMARACLVFDGYDERQLSRLPKDSLAQAALGFTHGLGLREPALHHTGSFTDLTLDAVNKSLRGAYEEAPSTWKGPMRQGPSASDFKDIHRVVMGAIPNLPTWDGIVAPDQSSFADAKETYSVECRSTKVSLGYKLLVNDDMSALGRLPAQLGQAAARTVNAYAWSIITSNPTLRDGIALFSAASGARKRQNLTTGAGAPSSTTINALTKLMMLMRGENTPEGNESDDVLSLMPVYIAGPAALKATIDALIRSVYDPGASNSITYNPNTYLQAVIEPRLDASSATAWYLFASPSQIDTIEISFLQGQETPAVRSFVDDDTLAQNYIVLQTFGGAALDHRGIQKHAGA